MSRRFLEACLALMLVAAVTAAGLPVAGLGMTGVVMLFLLAVMLASYFLGFPAALLSAVASFLAINYFFIDPRYTFEVASAESWAALLGFLMVSLVVASLVKRLKGQTLRAEQARRRAERARELSEQLAGLHDEDAVLEIGCRLIHEAVQLPVGIAVPDGHGESFGMVRQCPGGAAEPDRRALQWCCRNARMMGPGSDNWPELGMWLMPFERLPGVFPVLIVMQREPATEDDVIYLRGLLDQVAAAWQRVRNARRAAQAEMQVQQESVLNALLASVSHDMRTPLTAILGAATTLLGQAEALDASERRRLLQSLSTEAQHLADTTENILALSRLQILDARSLSLDWQAPEEIVGAVLQRYRNRVLPHELRSDVPPDAPLIRADAALLAQALGNLVDNALSAHRGAEPVWLGVEVADGKVALCVKDRGEGFPEDFRIEHIRKFQRFNAGGNGMGLGLTIVRTIAQLHGAELHIARREDGGASVALVFPAQLARDAND